MDRNIARLRWKCRRGMLELDIWLRRYLDDVYIKASSEEQADFEALLSEADRDIWDWLMGIQQPETQFSSIIVSIQSENNIPRIRT